MKSRTRHSPESLHGVFCANTERQIKALGITKNDLAERLDCTSSYIYQVLTGRRSLSLRTLDLWAKALETTPNALVRRPPAKRRSA
jgi:transcriptional regulator with XRE-family HTH domain